MGASYVFPWGLMRRGNRVRNGSFRTVPFVTTMACRLRGAAATKAHTTWSRLLSTVVDPNVDNAKYDGGHGSGGRRSREDRRNNGGGGGGGFLKTSAATIVGRRMAELIEASHPQEAVELFQQWKKGEAPESMGDFKPTLSAYSALMSATTRIHKHEPKESKMQAIKGIFTEMEQEGVHPNVHAYNEALRQCARVRDDDLAKLLFEDMGSAKIQPNKMTYLQLIASAVQSRQLNRALDFYHQLQVIPGQISGGLARFAQRTLQGLLGSCVRTKRMEQSEVILRDFREWGLQITPAAVGELILSAAGADSVSVTISLMEMLEDYPEYYLDEGTILVVLQCAARNRSAELTDLAWSSLEQTQHYFGQDFPSPIVCHARLACMIVNGQVEESLEYLLKIEAKYPEVTEDLNFVSSLVEHASVGESVADKVYFMLEERNQQEKKVPISAMNAVIAACSSMGDLERSFGTYEEMKGSFSLTPNAATFNALMTGCVRHGKPESVKLLQEEMKSANISPNKETFVHLVDATLLTEGAAPALGILGEMTNKGYAPPLKLMQKVRLHSNQSGNPEDMAKVTSLCEEHGYRSLIK